MTIKDVENLAELARIELTEDEKKELLKDIEHILEYVRQIEEVKGEDIKPNHLLRNVWREDEIIPREFSRELILTQFPDSENGFVKVKKII